MKIIFTTLREYKLAIIKIIFGCLVWFGLVSVFQNCSPKMKLNSAENPNVSPIGTGSKDTLVAPNTVKNKLIDGVEVSGFEAGTWIHAFVEDRCVLSRKATIQETPFYFLDKHLKQQYNFEENVGKFNISMVSFQLETFVSKSDFEDSLAFDACSNGTYASSSTPLGIVFNAPDSNSGFTNTWNQMGLNESVLGALLSLNGSTKVNVGIAGYGFKTDLNPPLPLSDNVVGLSKGKPNSLGTVLASIIASPKSEINFRGVADGVAQLTPLVMPETNKVANLVFSLVKQAVNRGSEVFVMPVWAAEDNFCDPLIGQALYYAIARGTTIILPAGNAVGGPTLPAGEIIGPRDFRLFESGKTAQVSCWARYFRGVINVASSTNKLDETEILSSSNFGNEGVELIAPGQEVTGMNDISQSQLVSGTEVSAALTAGAVAHIISFYKFKGWYYSPWLVEDTLMNGSRTASNLPLTGKTVRNRKVLDFSALKNFLAVLSSGTEADSRKQTTDNPESGQSMNLASVAPTEKAIRFDVYSKESNVYVKDRAQFQAVYYYRAGALKVVTDDVVWSSSDPINFPVDSHGVASPKIIGSFTISAKDPVTGSSSSYTTQAVDVDTVSGTNSKLVRIELKSKWDFSPAIEAVDGGYNMKTLWLSIDAFAVYEDGRKRLVTDYVAWALMYKGALLGGSETTSSFNNLHYLYGHFRGGEAHDLILYYRGHMEKTKLFAPTYEWIGWRWVPAAYNAYLKDRQMDGNTISVYNVGSWGKLSFKYPLCKLLGKEEICPRNPDDPEGPSWKCDTIICGRLNTSTLPKEGIVKSGAYVVHQAYKFWGDNTGTEMKSSIDVNLVEAPLTKVIDYFGMSIVAQGSSSAIFMKNDPIQLAPMCANLYAHIVNQNLDLGIKDDFFANRYYDSQSDITVTASGSPYTDFSGDKVKQRILFKKPADKIVVDYKLNDLLLNTKINGPTQLSGDPLDPIFNRTDSFFSKMNLVTPKKLPDLPIETALDARCGLPAKANGSHAGTGTELDPFLLCSWNDFLLMTKNTPAATLKMSYLALGNNIDLSGVTFPSVNLKEARGLDGRNYRIKNASMIDAENDLAIFLDVASAKNLVFLDNIITGKRTSLIQAKKISQIFAYNNTLTGTYVSGVSDAAGDCRNIYTKNKIRFSTFGVGIGSSGSIVFESFAEDDARYTGIVGDHSTYLGVGGGAIASGSASTITGGQRVSGVADSLCYKCYSNVNITTANFLWAGGIMLHLTTGGTIEVGESNATINVTGTGYAGGIAATVGKIDRTAYLYDLTSFYLGYFGHVNLVNSKFTGKISGSGFIGGLFGQSVTQTDLYITNTQVTGTVEGSGVKGSLVGKSEGVCVSTETPVIRTRGVSKDSSLPVIGERSPGVSIQNSVEY